MGDQEKQLLNSHLPSSTQIAFQTSMTSVISANIKHKKDFFHSTLKQPIVTPSVVIYYQKNFYFISQIDRKLSDLLSAGIIKHILDKYIDLRYWNIKQTKRNNQKLSLKHLEGVFVMWLIFISISFAIFIAEVAWKNI